MNLKVPLLDENVVSLKSLIEQEHISFGMILYLNLLMILK